ncbi:MAG: hypothetical protein H6710_23995 [Myxococcales bacterium]|nr:hypothetical protein [Myxococcales bacterium]
MSFARRYPGLEASAAWLAGRPELAGRPLITDIPVLGAILDRRGEGGERPLYYLLGRDQDHELRALTNPAVGQDAAILGALDRAFYGRPIRPPMTRTTHRRPSPLPRRRRRAPGPEPAAGRLGGSPAELARHGRTRILIDEGAPLPGQRAIADDDRRR